jgi:hypothetical protein
LRHRPISINLMLKVILKFAVTNIVIQSQGAH